MIAKTDTGERRIRVLIAHNAYKHPGGEDAVVEAEAALLRRNGHDVHIYRRSNDDTDAISRVRLAVDTLWSRRTERDVSQLCGDFRPDVIHSHNTLPLISPSLYWTAAREKVPVVQTLHNFRLLCPQGLLLRDSSVCEACVGKVPWRAVLHKCYRESASQSAAVTTMLQVHRMAGTWDNKVTAYIALNEFCRKKFALGGLPLAKIHVKPNFIDLPPAPDLPRRGFLFVGRLSSEKGIKSLIAASRRVNSKVEICVIGDGPMEDEVRKCETITAFGAMTPNGVYEQMSRAVALVVPSIWYENYPRTIVEAFANSLPVICSRIGAMATIVKDRSTGLLFPPGDAEELASTLEWAQNNPQKMLMMGRNAREYFENHLDGKSNYPRLVEIYRQSIASVVE